LRLVRRFRRVYAARDHVVRRFAVLLSPLAGLDDARQAVLRVIRAGALVAGDAQRVDVRDARGTGVLLSHVRVRTVRHRRRRRRHRRCGLRRRHHRRWLLRDDLRRFLYGDSRRGAAPRHGWVPAVGNVTADDAVAIDNADGDVRAAVMRLAAIVESPGQNQRRALRVDRQPGQGTLV